MSTRLTDLALAALLAAAAHAVEERPVKLTYPPTARGPSVEDFHGTTVADPYRWLEDLDSGDHDDRVVPAHSYKFAATLQERHRGDPPVLIRIDVKAGHGGGKPTSKRIEEAADRLTFLAHTVRLPVPTR